MSPTIKARRWRWGDRIVVMRKGEIAQSATPRDIYFAPASRFVAEFVGAANILEVTYNNGSLLLPGGKVLAAGVDQKTVKGRVKDRVFVTIRPRSRSE